MNQWLKLFLFVIVLLLLFFILNFFGIFFSFNQYFNSAPDKNCNVDYDCVLKEVHCHPCSYSEAVNKNWENVCIFWPPQVSCKLTIPDSDFNTKCVQNKCEKILKTNI